MESFTYTIDGSKAETTQASATQVEKEEVLHQVDLPLFLWIFSQMAAKDAKGAVLCTIPILIIIINLT